MKATVFIPLLLLSFYFFNCQRIPGKLSGPEWTVQRSPVSASFRGLHVVNNDVAWVSGSSGTVCRTINRGSSWSCQTIPGADSLDFRDVEAFDASHALVLSAGQPARIYRTVNAGETWTLVYENTTEGIFFDAMEFWDGKNGIAMSDPVAHHFVFITTSDSGKTWQQVPPGNIPEAQPGEAGFAASGTSLSVAARGKVWLGTGGAAARVLYSSDYGHQWKAVNTPMVAGKPSAGIFSVTFCDENYGVAVGGDYLQPADRGIHAIYTTNGGLSWEKGKPGPPGYRSCVTCVENSILVAVGTTGSDYSTDYGQSWHPLDTTGFHAVDFSPTGEAGWAVGAEGKIYRIDWPGKAATDHR